MQPINLRSLYKFFLSKEKSELEELLFSFKMIFLFLLLISIIINLIYIVPALYMFQIYDSVLTSRSFETLLGLTLIVIFFYLLNSFLNWSRSQALLFVSKVIDERLIPRIFPALIQSVVKTGSTASSQIYGDVATIRQFLTGTPIFALFDSPFFFIYLAIIFLIHPVLGIFSTISGIVALLLAIYSERVSRRGIQEANKAYQKAQTFLNTNLRNAEVIEAMGMHRQVFAKWKSLHEELIQNQQEASKKAAFYDSLIKFIRITSQSLILGLGAYYVIQNEITPGMMIMGSILMGRALSPIDLAIGSWKQFISFKQSYLRLKEFLINYPPPQKRLPLPIPKGVITVENLFVVPPGAKREVLKGVTINLQPGEITIVIGPSASGKSTLAKTLVGVWQPAIGSVKLDGAALSLYPKEHLGQYIGYLPQDIELFSGTIAENIARYGEVNMELVVKASILAGIHDMILKLPEGYETEIGEGGAYLSGGQRQRIALARALYGDPIFIVLDEPNSNLDEEGHRSLINTLLYLKKQNKTVVVITHHPSILSVADKLLVLRDGVALHFGPAKQVLELLYQQSKQISAQAQSQLEG